MRCSHHWMSPKSASRTAAQTRSSSAIFAWRSLAGTLRRWTRSWTQSSRWAVFHKLQSVSRACVSVGGTMQNLPSFRKACCSKIVSAGCRPMMPGRPRPPWTPSWPSTSALPRSSMASLWLFCSSHYLSPCKYVAMACWLATLHVVADIHGQNW